MIQQQKKSDAQMLTTINQIDSQMQSLYQNLERLSVQSSPDLNKQQQIINEIENLQKLKKDLYQNFSDSYASQQANVAESRDALVNEVAVGGVVQHELKNANKNLKLLEQQRFNELRMAEINDYYSDKYTTQTSVMKTIVYFSIPILILGILMKKEILSKNIALAIIGVLGGICVFIVIMQSIDIMRRSNMVFDEYNFPSNPDELANQAGSGTGAQPKARNMTLGCTGEACCPDGNNFGTTWDSDNKQCVTPDYLNSNTNTDTNTDTENFVGERCLQNSFNKSDFNVNIFKNNGGSVNGFSEKDDGYAKF